MLAEGLADVLPRQSRPKLSSVLKASHLRHRLNYVGHPAIPISTKLPLPQDRLSNRQNQLNRVKPRKPVSFRTIPSLSDEVDYSALRLVKSIAATTGYNLSGLYSHLLEEGHSCTWYDGRNALHFELSHRTWREMLLTHVQIQTLPQNPARGRELQPQGRMARSKSADASPPNVSNWLKSSAPSYSTKIDCFVFASGAVVIWGLKAQLHIRSGNAGGCTRDDAAVGTPVGPQVLSRTEFQSMSQSNATWNNDLSSATLWFLSQFAELPIRADWISEDNLHYSEGRDRPRKPRDGNGRRRHVDRLSHDHLYLKGSELEEKFAASLALQQNVILAVFEEAFESNLKSLGHEAFTQQSQAIASGHELRLGKRSLLQKAWRFIVYTFGGPETPESEDLHGNTLVQKVAYLYLKVIDINLVQKIVDVPEYFWEHPEYQKVWRAVHGYLEVAPRVSVLNNRCSWIQQLLTDLTQSRQDAREVELTWICILWITIYVITLFVKMIIERK